ncbi:MAG: 50S ribosomal protein L25 [Gemmatimonadales bacterium]
MPEQITISARTRQATGKGAARTLRRQGQVPAVIYGHDRAPEALVLEGGTLGRTLLTAGHTALVDVAVDGREPVKALVREVQRDPLSQARVLHVDLYEVRADEPVEVSVPVHLVGIPDGVRNFGGVLDHSMRELDIKVLPGEIPASIDLDVTNLAIGHSLFVRDVKVEKVKILNDADLPICSVVAPRAEEAPTPVVAEEVPSTEPELIRKPRAEDEAEEESKD